MTDEPKHLGDKKQSDSERMLKFQRRSIQLTSVAEVLIGILVAVGAGLALTQLGRGASAITKASTSFAVLAAVGAVATVGFALLALRQSSSKRELRRYRIRISDLESELGLRATPSETQGTSTADESKPRLVESGDTGSPPPPTTPLSSIGADDSNRKWWRAAILTLLVTIFAGIFSLVAAEIAKADPPPNCVAYLQEITSLDRQYGHANVLRALHVIRLNSYSDQCGSASSILNALDGSTG